MTARKSGDLGGRRRMGGRRHLGIGLAPAISALAAAVAFSPAFASAADVGELEEIMVTAQKREQRLQDVGISISALRAEDVERLGIRDTTDIVSVVPSLQFNRFSPAYTVFNVRGVSQNDYGDQQEPPIAVYQDDSYASTLNLGGFPVFDLESIQVLRGPQGTLFGRNATGGLIQYLTKKPTKEFEAYVRPTAGRFKEFDIEGAVSGPLGRSVQGRLAFQRSKNEGYFQNIFGGRNGSVDNYAVRGELTAQPTENVSGLFTVRYARNMKESTGGNYSWQLAYPGEHGLGEFAGPNDPSPFGTCDGCDLGGYKNPALNPQWGGDPWKLAFTDSADFDRSLRGASFKLDVDAGAVDLVSVTDYIGMSKTYNEDSDASPNAVWKYRAENNLKQFSQELRAGGETGKNTWVVGAFYMHVNGHYQASLPFPIFDYTPANRFRQTTSSWALFAQNEFKINDHWSFIAGGRAWRDKREIDFHIDDNFGVVVDYNKALYPGLADRTFKDFSGKLEVDYKFTDGTLAYLSFNRGTKSGGFTVSPVTPVGTPESIQAYVDGIPYKPEVLESTELGLKTELFGGTTAVQADVFHYNYKNYQAYFLLGTVSTIRNAPARAHGFELQVSSRPVDGLTIDIGMSVLRTRVKNVVLPDGFVRDSELPQAPGFSGHLLAGYEMPAGDGMAGVQFLTTYTGESCFSVLCAPVDVEGSRAVSEGRLTYRANSGRWDVALWCKNLTNKRYRLFNSDASFAGVVESVYAPPRWYGVTATVQLGTPRR